jgi:hypothetical protein
MGLVLLFSRYGEYPKDLIGDIHPNTQKQQLGIGYAWMSTNWSGVCDKLTRVSSPTLIVSGTDDNNVPSGFVRKVC